MDKRISDARFEMFGSGGHVQDDHTYELWEWLQAEREYVAELGAELATVNSLLDMKRERAQHWNDEAWKYKKRAEQAEALNKKAVYGCCEECGIEADLRQAEAFIEEWRATTKAIADERDALRDLVTRLVPFIGYDALVQDLVKEAQDAVQYGQPREGGE